MDTTNDDPAFLNVKKINTVTIVGVGLISGSFALNLKEKNLANYFIGVSRTEASAKKALELGLVDEMLPLEEAVKKSRFNLCCHSC